MSRDRLIEIADGTSGTLSVIIALDVLVSMVVLRVVAVKSSYIVSAIGFSLVPILAAAENESMKI